MNICVFGAAGIDIDKSYIDEIEKMGEHLAKKGHNLVFGAGETGAMGAASRGFKRGGGTIHGVVPAFFRENLDEYVNWNCDKLTVTDTMRERKAVMEDEADSFVIAPGGIGTFEELFEVMTLKQLGQHRKPIAIFNINGYYDSLIALLEEAMQKKFVKENCRYLYKVFTDIDEMCDYLENDNMNNLTVNDLK